MRSKASGFDVENGVAHRDDDNLDPGIESSLIASRQTPMTEKKGAWPRRRPYKLSYKSVVVAVGYRWHLRLFLRFLRDHRLSGDEQARYECSILQGYTDDLSGIDDVAFNACEQISPGEI
jgi:hypothetical protein